jgi:hypothetical protein
MPNIKTILVTVVIVLVVVWLTAKFDESRNKNDKKLIFSPNLK